MELKFKIKEIRKSRRLTLLELSKLCGVSVSQLSDIENNKSDPKFSTIVLISRALNAELSDVYYM